MCKYFAYQPVEEKNVELLVQNIQWQQTDSIYVNMYDIRCVLCPVCPSVSDQLCLTVCVCPSVSDRLCLSVCVCPSVSVRLCQSVFVCLSLSFRLYSVYSIRTKPTLVHYSSRRSILIKSALTHLQKRTELIFSFRGKKFTS